MLYEDDVNIAAWHTGARRRATDLNAESTISAGDVFEKWDFSHLQHCVTQLRCDARRDTYAQFQLSI